MIVRNREWAERAERAERGGNKVVAAVECFELLSTRQDNQNGESR